jgi:hypothetical protein
MPRNSGIRPRPPFSSETCLCAYFGSRLQKLKGCQGEKYDSGGGEGAVMPLGGFTLKMTMTIIVSNHFSRFLVNRSRGHGRTTYNI